ncbi:uncharacterized protein LOC144602968 [Rhinoraja longicauda]
MYRSIVKATVSQNEQSMDANARGFNLSDSFTRIAKLASLTVPGRVTQEDAANHTKVNIIDLDGLIAYPCQNDAVHCVHFVTLLCSSVQASLKVAVGSEAANLMAIVILCRGKCGLSKCITRYLVYMAAADLMVLIFEVILYEIKDAYWPYSLLNYTPVCSVNLALLFFSIDCSVWLTVAFTFDRLIAISCQSLRTKYCTEKIAAIAIAIVCLLSALENIPIFFVYEHREILNGLPWSCYVKSSFYTDPMWIAFLWLETILCPFAPFILIMLLNSLTIRHIVRANRVRSALRGTISHIDPEIDNRRKSIILLLAISGNFIFLWMVLFICYLFVHFTDTQFLEANYNDPFTIAEQSGYMLRCLSACTNTFIYAVSQGKFREELKNIVRRPLSIFTSSKYIINFNHPK